MEVLWSLDSGLVALIVLGAAALGILLASVSWVFGAVVMGVGAGFGAVYLAKNHVPYDSMSWFGVALLIIIAFALLAFSGWPGRPGLRRIFENY